MAFMRIPIREPTASPESAICALPMLKPMAAGVFFNVRTELPINRPVVLSNGDTFKIGDTIFEYVES